MYPSIGAKKQLLLILWTIHDRSHVYEAYTMISKEKSICLQQITW